MEPAQWRIARRSSADRSTPSVSRKPAVRSKSSPGVRIVTARDSPATRISSGSSTTRVSGRATVRAPSNRSTCRRAVTRPMTEHSTSAAPGRPAGRRTRTHRRRSWCAQRTCVRRVAGTSRTTITFRPHPHPPHSLSRSVQDSAPAGVGCGPSPLGGWIAVPGGRSAGMDPRTWLDSWPVFRQLTGTDPLGRGSAAMSKRSAELAPRTVTADRGDHSVCPFCAVGCGQRVYVKDDQVIQIEGDPDSPVSRGRLCPKGSASKQLVTHPGREHTISYRRPYGTEWEELDLDTAMDMIADRVIKTRNETWQWAEDGKRTRRTMGIASLGGATLDNEENYLMKKLYTAMGAIQVENQARI